MTETKRSKRLPKATLEKIGKGATGVCIGITVLLVFTLVFMVAQRGLATFFVNGITLPEMLTNDVWAPTREGDNGRPLVGALPMIIGSFSVTILSTLIATPLSICAAIFVVEIFPEFGRKVLSPAIELLVGVPSVVYGLIGLYVIVKWTSTWSGTTGYGIFSSSIVLAVMILPTITSLTIDALAAVPDSYRQGALALGSTRWQMVYKVVIPAALPSIATAVILGMTRAFGEALAVQMVIGNAAMVPDSLFTPASTLTSILTMGMGNSVMGTLENNALWTLALMLMIMSLVFIIIIHFIEHLGSTKEN